MREKILSLAKGNFIYETPKLCLSIEKLVFEVTAGTHGTASFFLEKSTFFPHHERRWQITRDK